MLLNGSGSSSALAGLSADGFGFSIGFVTSQQLLWIIWIADA